MAIKMKCSSWTAGAVTITYCRRASLLHTELSGNPQTHSALLFLLYLQRMSENSVFPSLLTVALVYLSYSKTEDCFFRSGASPLSPAASWGLVFRCPSTASNSLCLKASSWVLAQQQSISPCILYLEILYLI